MTWPVHNSPPSSANGTTIGSKSEKFFPRPSHFSLRFLKSDRLLALERRSEHNCSARRASAGVYPHQKTLSFRPKGKSAFRRLKSNSARSPDEAYVADTVRRALPAKLRHAVGATFNTSSSVVIPCATFIAPDKRSGFMPDRYASARTAARSVRSVISFFNSGVINRIS